MRGRDVFMESLLANGATAIFGNPGTTENPLLEALFDYPDFNYYVALHEGVAVCAAGGYAQATGKTAVTNLHVAPGLGNAIGMMYGCLKSRVPVLVTAGAQDIRLRLREPLLGHDLVAMAQPVCKWAAEPRSADEIAPMVAKALTIANQEPKGPVFLALPNNVMEQATNVGPLPPVPHVQPATPDPSRITDLAAALIASSNPAILAGDSLADPGVNADFLALVDTLGADVYTDFLPGRCPILPYHPAFRSSVPAHTNGINKLLEPHDLILLMGGMRLEEVWFDDVPLIPEGAVVAQVESTDALLRPDLGVDKSLVGGLGQICRLLTDEITEQADASFSTRVEESRGRQKKAAEGRQQNWTSRVEKLSGMDPMTASEALTALAGALGDNLVIVDESITASPEVEQVFGSNFRDFYAGRGGGIGQGIAGAIGVGAAHPDRTVVAISGDGSAMYSIQALWSAAHHNLKVIFVIMANAEYRILKHNLDLHRQRFDAPSDQAYPHMDLTNPSLTFVDMAQGMGVPGVRAGNADEVAQAGADAMAADGPFLIELVVAGKEN